MYDIQQTKAERARSLRYKRPALDSMGYDFISDELCKISEVCSNIHWFAGQEDETLLNALDGNEEDEYEFRVAFANLEVKVAQLTQALQDHMCEIRDYFDDCTVALIGNRYNVLGFDTIEEDYYALSSFESELAVTESGKRLMRHTKAEMLSMIGQCMGITLAYYDIRHSFDYLKATMDILRDENTSLLKVIKDINTAYEEENEEGFMNQTEGNKFNALLNQLPDRIWLE